MPELPEVETIKRSLEPRLRGSIIRGVELGDRRVLKVDPAVLEAALPGQEVQGMSRRGKYLVIRLSRNNLVIHLGMTGQLTIRDPAAHDSQEFHRQPQTGLQRIRQHAPDRHTHLQILFEDFDCLLFRDVRMFGKVFLLPLDCGATEAFFSHLGLEPFGDGYQLDAFLDRMRTRSGVRIKSLLLDQSFVAGVGNIYADEALFEARIHPGKRVRNMSQRQRSRLFQAILVVLEKGIAFGGTTLRDFIDSDGRLGSNQDELCVYGRDGLPCPRCATPVRKTVISQRGTHFCPACQRR